MEEIIQPLELAGYSCKWSPHNAELLAVSSCKNFGFLGQSKIEIFALNQTTNQLSSIAQHTNADCVYDIAWCPARNSVVLYGNGIGGLYGWDVLTNSVVFGCEHAHWQEISSIDASYIKPQQFLTSSWDNTIRLWDITQLPAMSQLPDSNNSSKSSSIQQISNSLFEDVPLTGNLTGDSLCIDTFRSKSNVNCVTYHPKFQDLFVGVGQNGVIELWDTNSSHQSALSWSGHNKIEVLSADFDKYNSYQLYTSGSDHYIYVWDIRHVKEPLLELCDHQLGVKRIQASPFKPGVLLSSGFDMNVFLWDISTATPKKPSDSSSTSTTATSSPNNTTTSKQYIKGKYDAHTEFAFGLSWNLLIPDLIATASFDNTVRVWNTSKMKPFI